jgi:uncharacterized protein YcfJ
MTASLASSPALAHHKQHRDRDHQQHRHGPSAHYEYGRVIKAKPIYETRVTSTPRQSCWQEQVTTHRQSGSNSSTGTIVGGIIGAAVGHELGHKKRNKQIGAVAGAVLGSSIGYDLTRGKRHSRPVHSTRERCETVYDEHSDRVVVGYRVKYRYNGQIYRTRMDRHPGDRIKLKVSVTPVY